MASIFLRKFYQVKQSSNQYEEVQYLMTINQK